MLTLSSPRGWEQRFEASVVARLDGPFLTAWNKRMTQADTLPELTGVTVQRYDARGAIRTGIVLTVLGAAMTAGGAIF